MTPVVNAWIIRKIAIGGFSHRRDVFRFALTRTIITTAAAVLLNFAMYQVLGRFGIFNIVIPADSVADTIVTALVAGPISFLAFYLVGSAIYDLAVSRDAFERISRTDALSGLLNRRAFMECFDKTDSRAALVLFDIDRFKAVNDTYGHAAGDQVIVSVANSLSEAFADGHVVARFGGEEFTVLMLGLTDRECQDRADKARELISRRPFEFAFETRTITISAGHASCRDYPDFTTLFSAADRALYLAKASGRNRVMHARDLTPLLKSAINDERRTG